MEKGKLISTFKNKKYMLYLKKNQKKQKTKLTLQLGNQQIEA